MMKSFSSSRARGWRGRRELAPRRSATQLRACSLWFIDRDLPYHSGPHHNHHNHHNHHTGSNRFVTHLVRSCEEWTSLAGDPQPVESRSEEESGGCVHGGAMNSSPSAWPWALQHITVRSSTPLQGVRGQAPGPERVRCSSRAKPQGDRTHLTQGSGQHRCWRCGRRGNLSGTRAGAQPRDAADGRTFGGSR